MKPLNIVKVSLLVFVATLSMSVAKTQTSSATAPDYSKPEVWVCRPGHDSVCTTGLDAMMIDNSGKRTLRKFTPDKDPAVDCFYVYPTVSHEPGQNADLTIGPDVQRTVHEQAGHLSSLCRVFAPVYRQSTLAALHSRLNGTPMGARSAIAEEDVKAAWKYYLDHDNHGRGVVLVGHSQGTGMLQALLRDEIDGKDAQKLLVSAILGGYGSLAAKPGTRVGGTYQHIPACSSASETGCIYAWGSYLEGSTAVPVFGHPRTDGMISLCVNPAAPDGGVGALKYFYLKPTTAPASDPPYVEAIGQLTGQCKPFNGGNAFVVHIVDGPYEETMRQLLSKQSQGLATWGLHGKDMGLVQGNILDVVSAEIAVWKKK